METINYQGQQIEARQIAEINVARGEGMDFILRDEAGRYYRRRDLNDGDPISLLHRISTKAAILWVVAIGGDLAGWIREDAANLLMDGRGLPYSPTRNLSRLAALSGF